MPTKSLAQNETIVLKIPQNKSQVATMATAAATAAGATFVVEAEFVTGEWVPVGVFDAVAQGAVDNIVGPSQYAWTDVPGGQQARVRRTDGTGGNGTVAFNMMEA